MSDFKRDLRRYIDGLQEPVSVEETMSRGREERRFRIPVAVLAGAAVVLAPALVLGLLRLLPTNDGDVADTTVPSTTVTSTTVAETAPTQPEPTITPVGVVEVPNLDGLTETEARTVLGEIGLELEITEMYPSRSGIGLITAQDPLAGDTADEGSTVIVGVRVEAPCLAGLTAPEVPEGSMPVTVLFECAGDWLFPDVSTEVTRVVPTSSKVTEATLQALMAGLTEEERLMGYGSFFSAESAGALDSVTLNEDRLIVDFNDAILIGNTSTSTGGLYFLAELQANVFQFPEVESVEFRLNGSCDAFYGWLQGECEIQTRTQWQEATRYWDSQRDAQPALGQPLGADEVVGRTFTASRVDGSSAIAQVIDGGLFATTFSEVGGWLLDDATGEMENWALHVAGSDGEMIWLVESQGHAAGHMRYEVKATLELPWDEVTLTADPFVMGGMNDCTADGVYDPSLVVMALGGGTEEMTEVMAWTIDIPGATFVEIDVDRVECFMETGG